MINKGLYQAVTAKKWLCFKVLGCAQLPRIFQDADLVGLTNDYVKVADFTPQNALLKENKDSPYANVIVVRTKDKNKQTLKKLVKVMHLHEVLQETKKLFPNGAAILA